MNPDWFHRILIEVGIPILASRNPYSCIRCHIGGDDEPAVWHAGLFEEGELALRGKKTLFNPF